MPTPLRAKAHLTRTELTALVDRKEIESAYRLLSKRLNEKAKGLRHQIGWQNGRRDVKVRWHERWGFWVVLNPKMKANRFWIGFGLQNPRRHRTLTITCEVNPPKEGVDRRSAGIFMKDSTGHLVLGHTGKVGGGRPGIGKRAFLKNYEGNLRRTVSKSGAKTIYSDAIVIGRIAAPDFLHRLSQFLVDVDQFKQDVRSSESTVEGFLRKQHFKADSEGKFNPENLRDAREKLFATIVIRRGQDAFRKKLIREYDGRCAITGFDCVDALEAAHIRPYLGDETNHTSNGLLLRSDLHTLFDLKKITIAGDYTVRVSKGLDATAYRKLKGKKLKMPRNPKLRPNLKALAMHRSEMTTL